MTGNFHYVLSGIACRGTKNGEKDLVYRLSSVRADEGTIVDSTGRKIGRPGAGRSLEKPLGGGNCPRPADPDYPDPAGAYGSGNRSYGVVG